MAIQPSFLEMSAPGVEKRLIIGIGFFWGGDATKPLPAMAEDQFKDAVTEKVERDLLGDPELLQSIVADCDPSGWELRYRGGNTTTAFERLLEKAVDDVKSAMPSVVRRHPGAVLMQS